MTLKIYPVTLELVRRLAPFLPKVRARSSSLGDQMERSLISIPLNIAEGAWTQSAKSFSALCFSGKYSAHAGIAAAELPKI